MVIVYVFLTKMIYLYKIKIKYLCKKCFSIWRKIKENLIYKSAALIFKQNKLILMSASYNDKFGNITALAKTLQKKSIPFIWITHEELRKNTFNVLILLAQAHVLVIDAESPAARIKIHHNTCLIHCWHACGAYKKIGFDAKRKNYDDISEEKRIKRIHRDISWFVCTSDETAKIYANAFRIPLEKFLIFGSPRLDELIQQKKYSIPSQYTILYAPTYRTYKNKRYLPKLPDAKVLRETLTSKLGVNVRLAFRGHPTTPLPKDYNGWENWSNFDQNYALSHTSVLITDYSSIFFDFLLFNRPIVFYVPDLKKYIKNERELYFSPYKIFPSTTCSQENELIIMLYKCYNIKIDYKEIWKKYMSACDGNSSEHLCSFIASYMR